VKMKDKYGWAAGDVVWSKPVAKVYTERLHPRDTHGRWTDSGGGVAVDARPAWKPTMSFAEARAFIAGSAYDRPVYRLSKPENIERIKTEGFDPSIGSRFARDIFGEGAYFTPAEGTGGAMSDIYAMGGRQELTAFVRMENPLVLDYGANDTRRTAGQIRQQALDEAGVTTREMTAAEVGAMSDSRFTGLIRNAGYDGIIVHGSREDATLGGPQVIAFEREQIVVIDESVNVQKYSATQLRGPDGRWVDGGAGDRAALMSDPDTWRQALEGGANWSEPAPNGVSTAVETLGDKAAVFARKDGKLIGTLRFRQTGFASWDGGDDFIVSGVNVKVAERNKGIATQMLEAFHEAHPDAMVTHGGFVSWEGWQWGQDMVAAHPGWNRMHASDSDPPSYLEKPSWMAKAARGLTDPVDFWKAFEESEHPRDDKGRFADKAGADFEHNVLAYGDEETHVTFATVGGEHVGRVDYSLQDVQGRIAIEDIYVREDMRGQGVGRALLEKVHEDHPGLKLTYGDRSFAGRKLIESLPPEWVGRRIGGSEDVESYPEHPHVLELSESEREHVAKAYEESQHPRDQDGQWTDGWSGREQGFEKLGKPLAAKYRAALGHLEHRFPEALGGLQGVVVRPFGRGESRTSAMYLPGSRGLALNAAQKTEAKLGTGYAYDAGKPAEAAVYHEFGHYLEDTMFGAPPSGNDIAPVSRYAQSKPDNQRTMFSEHFAELFAAYMLGDDDPAIRSWGQELERVMAEKGGQGWKAPVAKYSATQPRDEDGRWLKAGGSLGLVDHSPDTESKAWKDITKVIAKQGRGNCFEAAVTLAKNAEKLGLKNPVIVQATVAGQGDLKGKRFVHTWLEADAQGLDHPEAGLVMFRAAYDWASGNTGVMPDALYRHLGRVDEVHEYPWGPMAGKTDAEVQEAHDAGLVGGDTQLLMLAQGSYGPWSEDLKRYYDDGKNGVV